MVLKTLFSVFAKFKPARIAPSLLVFDKPSLDLYRYPCLFEVYNNFTTKTPILSKTEHKTDIADTDINGFDQSKAKIILTLNFKSADDCLPFYKLPIKKLLRIQKITKNDESKKYCENRLYYISSKIKCPPAIVSEKISRRTFVYDLSFDWLEKSLDTLLGKRWRSIVEMLFTRLPERGSQTMFIESFIHIRSDIMEKSVNTNIEKGVTGDRILRDLWVLKYYHKTISERLQKIQDMGLDTLYPWMVRCSPEILAKYITLTQETKNILGESRSTQMYLADRLNISMEAVEEMSVKMPALKKIRVTKIKKFLDFLMDEGFSAEEIADKFRVLQSSQKTIKHRLDKLRNIGVNDINLNFLCRSRKSFQKYYESLERVLK